MEDATVTEITKIAPDVRQYIVETETGRFDGRPGQHTVISRPDGGTKPYTATAVDGERIGLAIRDYGGDGVSSYMSEIETGDTVRLEPNLSGNLYLRDETRPVALVSTGIGVTPMLGILNEYVDRGEEEATFLLGEKSSDFLLFKEMIDQYTLLHNVKAEYVLSREEWDGRNGYVQEHLKEVSDATEDTRTDFYVCGVPKMVIQTKRKLSKLGVPDERVHSEGWEEGSVGS